MGSGLLDGIRLSFLVLETPDRFGSFDALSEALRRIKGLGYEGVELQLTRPAGFAAGALAEFVESIHLPVVSFLSGDNYVREGLCMSSADNEVRQRAVERLKECSKTAARFGSVLIVGMMLGDLNDEPRRALGEARIEECLKRVVEAAEEHGTTIALEPLNRPEGGFFNTLHDVLDLTARFGSARLKPMLDTFHMFRNIEEKTMVEPIRRVGQDLAHVHLCETNGGPLGRGELDFKAIFEALRSIHYSGYVSVKVHEQSWAVAAETSMHFLTGLGASDAQ